MMVVLQIVRKLDLRVFGKRSENAYVKILDGNIQDTYCENSSTEREGDLVMELLEVLASWPNLCY